MIQYRDKVGARLIKACDQIIGMIKLDILNRLHKEEFKAFFICMLADYMRYKAEALNGEK